MVRTDDRCFAQRSLLPKTLGRQNTLVLPLGSLDLSRQPSVSRSLWQSLSMLFTRASAFLDRIAIKIAK